MTARMLSNLVARTRLAKRDGAIGQGAGEEARRRPASRIGIPASVGR